jgi:hypothetical protein
MSAVGFQNEASAVLRDEIPRGQGGGGWVEKLFPRWWKRCRLRMRWLAVGRYWAVVVGMGSVESLSEGMVLVGCCW